MKIKIWIVCNDGTHPEHPYAFRCLRCGEIQDTPPHCSIDGFVKLGRQFERAHANCKPSLFYATVSTADPANP